MKKLIALAILTVSLAIPARAQWVVYDPVNNMQQILAAAEEIAKYIEMINNQVQQITTLRDQLTSMNHYIDLFGDPKAIAISVATPLISDLRRTEVGESLAAIIQAADGADALLYDANGLYHNIGATFQTPHGVNINRSADDYRPFAAVNEATANYHAVSTNTAARRVELKTQIAATIEQLRNASTDAEVQKLGATLTGLTAALSGTEQEANQALATALVQDIENRNDERKQQAAIKEQQSAAFSEALDNYGKTFRLLQGPTRFPAP